MKRRLGVVAALLKGLAPSILDGLTNGLDPMGMAKMRALIPRRGTDREVEHIGDRVRVIHGGRLVAAGRVAELRGDASLLVRAAP